MVAELPSHCGGGPARTVWWQSDMEESLYYCYVSYISPTETKRASLSNAVNLVPSLVSGFIYINK